MRSMNTVSGIERLSGNPLCYLSLISMVCVVRVEGPSRDEVATVTPTLHVEGLSKDGMLTCMNQKR